MRIDRFFSGLFVSFCLIGFFLTRSYGDNIRTVTADIRSASCAILVEASTGQAICGHNENVRASIASVTKIMTLLIAAERIESGALSLDETAVCSAYASSMDGSVIWLEPGEKMTVRDLVRSVVIASANDACVMLGEHIAGSEEEFVGLMNDKARELGMTNTHFSNCVGYDDPDHYSTAADVSIMAAQLRKYSVYDEYLLTRLDSVRTGTKRETQLLNTNKLITGYSGITGLKTGTTDGAGYCFVGSARRGDMELIAVILGCDSDDDRFTAAKNLLDYGFENCEKVTPHPDTAFLVEIPVKNGVKNGVDTRFSGISEMILPKGSGAGLKYHYSTAGAVEAPVEKGQTLGFVTITSGDEIIATAKIIAAEEVERLDYNKCLEYMIKEFFRF